MGELKLKIQVGNALLEVDGNSDDVQKERENFLNFLGECVENHILTPDQRLIAQELKTEPLLLNNPRRNISFAELRREKGFKNFTDIVMGAAWFLCRHRDKETFTTNDIKEILQRSHIKASGNVTQAVNDNIKKGLIEEYKTAKENGNGKILRILDSADEWMGAHSKN